MKVIYEVTNNTDLTEGRGHQKHVAFFYDKDDALKCAEDQPKIMDVGKAYDINEMIIYDTYQQWKNQGLKKLREQALSKLTLEERVALGFK